MRKAASRSYLRDMRYPAAVPTTTNTHPLQNMPALEKPTPNAITKEAISRIVTAVHAAAVLPWLSIASDIILLWLSGLSLLCLYY